MNEIKEFFKMTKGIKTRLGLRILLYIINIIKISCLMVQPIIFSQLLDRVIKNGEKDLLNPLIIISGALIFFSFFLDLGLGVLSRYIYTHATIDTREFILAHMRRVAIYEIEKESPAKFQMLLGEDSHMVSNFHVYVLLDVFSQFYMISFGICALFVMNWLLGLAGILIIALLGGVPTLIKKPLSRHLNHVRTHREEIGQILFETVEGSKEVKTLGLEKWEQEKNRKVYKGLIKSSVLDSFFQSISTETTRVVIGIVIIVVYWFGAKLIFDNSLTVGLLVLSVMYLQQSLQRLQSINQKYGAFRSASVSAKRITDFLKVSPEQGCILRTSGKKATPGKNMIELKNLSLSLNGVSILSDVNLEVPTGNKVALIGLSGSGKTSLYKMLLGFIPKQQGDIYIDGNSITELSRVDINYYLGWVSQAPFLFQGTLYDNIILGNLNASREEVYEAALKSNLKELIEKSPQGLDMELSNKGLQLSGGERQRIIIARMMLKKPKILLLDEPTSSLDRLTERDVIRALDTLMDGQTTIVSTHRLETIRNADIIYVINNGHISARGTHNQLLDSSPDYNKMVKLFEGEKNG